MFEPRSLATIQAEFFQTLLSENTTLSDINPGSALYTLSRVIAALQSNADLSLLGLSNTFYIDSSTGKDLEEKAADFNITRKPGDYAIGYALGISQGDSFTATPGNIFTDPLTTLQFEVTGQPGQDSYVVTSFSETKIPIRCTSIGERGNLSAGTKLISPTFPQGKFAIAAHRTTAGQYCGDMSGGRDPEQDEQLRARLQASILYSRATTEESIKALILAEKTVPWVSIIVPVPGVIQVWVDNPSPLSNAELTRLQSVAEAARPAGTILTVQQVTRYLIEVNVTITPDWSVDIQTLTDVIAGTCKVYLTGLGINQPFVRADLLTQIRSLKGVASANMIAPAVDVTPDSGEVVRSSKISVTYET
jgi:uncharacterized phage protein gp47/JayE